MRSKKIVILLIVIDIMMMTVICNVINKSIIKEKQIIKEMSESTQITDLNNQINALNKEHTEYMDYIQTCKKSIAAALTNEGVITSEHDNFETMFTNIGNIFNERTKLDESIAATADNISKGKQAYVNGELITGTGEYNDFYYDKGASENSKSLTINGKVSASTSAWTNTDPDGEKSKASLGATSASGVVTVDISNYSSLKVNSISNCTITLDGTKVTASTNTVIDISEYSKLVLSISKSQAAQASYNTMSYSLSGSYNITLD